MFTRPWLDPSEIVVPDALAAAVGGHRLVAETLARRGLTDPAAALAFLDPDRYVPAPASELPGMGRAVTRLGRAIRTGEPICVWGDFDVDGQTATALLASTLRDLGANVSYHVPLRATEGHGISLPVLKEVIAGGARLILTCDTGIAAHAAVAYARTQRVDVIITDHHDLPKQLPAAAAIINPKLLAAAGSVADRPELYSAGAGLPTVPPAGSVTDRPELHSAGAGLLTVPPAGSVTDRPELHSAGAGLLTVPPAGSVADRPELLKPPHPLSDLPGVGVAYKLAEALYAQARRQQDAAKHLDLVALGIVADLARQRGDTRYLLQRGLAVLRRGERPGLRPLLEAAELSPEHLSEEHIGFVLAPRLNAAGRLADAGPCVELLTTADMTRARIITADLEALNAQRKRQCDQVEAGAEAQIFNDRSLLDDAALVLASPHWPAGVIGIVASRLVEKYGKPAILIATPPGVPGQASARSVDGINITAAIAATNAAHPDLLLGFGGHPMAAGFTIDPERIPEFRRGLARTVAAAAAGRSEPEALRIDGSLPLAELSPALVDDLARLAPFGPGNPPLVLAAHRVRVLNSRTVGHDGAHRLLLVAGEAGDEHKVIRWNGGSEEPPEGLFDLAYVARASTFRGAREVQVEWVAARLVGAGLAPALGAGGAGARPAPTVTVEDYRRVEGPRQVLDGLVARGDTSPGDTSSGGVTVWREGEAAADLAGHDRRDLPPAGTLVIWTIPPGPAELRAVLAQVRPARVCLFSQDPGADRPDAFMRRLAGLVKHALAAKEGRASLDALAAVTAQRRVTVEMGLARLAARGDIRIAAQTGDEIVLAAGDGMPQPPARLSAAETRLKAALAETAAYRKFYREAEAAGLVPG